MTTLEKPTDPNSESTASSTVANSAAPAHGAHDHDTGPSIVAQIASDFIEDDTTNVNAIKQGVALGVVILGVLGTVCWMLGLTALPTYGV